MGGHEGVARPGDAADGDGWRAEHQVAAVERGGERAGAVGHAEPVRAPGRKAAGGGGRVGIGALAQDARLGQVEIERGAGACQERVQPCGLAGAGRGQAQVGAGKERRDGDLREERGREVAVERDEAGPGSSGAAEAAVGEGREDGLALRGSIRLALRPGACKTPGQGITGPYFTDGGGSARGDIPAGPPVGASLILRRGTNRKG